MAIKNFTPKSLAIFGDKEESKLLVLYRDATPKAQKMMLEVCQSIRRVCPTAFIPLTIEQMEHVDESRRRDTDARRAKLRLVSSR